MPCSFFRFHRARAAFRAISRRRSALRRLARRLARATAAGFFLAAFCFAMACHLTVSFNACASKNSLDKETPIYYASASMKKIQTDTQGAALEWAAGRGTPWGWLGWSQCCGGPPPFWWEGAGDDLGYTPPTLLQPGTEGVGPSCMEGHVAPEVEPGASVLGAPEADESPPALLEHGGEMIAGQVARKLLIWQSGQ